MIINHERKYIFVHVPKTGGNSIYDVLGTQSPGGSHQKAKHKKAKYPDYFTFGFVRNPWDRMVSLYHFCAQKPKSHRGYRPEFARQGFRETLLNTKRTGVLMDTGQIDAWSYLEGCDFVGRFERFQKDFDYICEIIGVGKTNLKKMNASIHDHYTTYYDDETIEFVAKTHATTIERFNYTFK